MIKEPNNNGIDMDYVTNKLVYDMFHDVLKLNDRLNSKIGYNENQVFTIIGLHIETQLRTYRALQNKLVKIKGLNTMSIVRLKNEIKKKFGYKSKKKTNDSNVLHLPTLGTEETRLLLSRKDDYGWIKKSRYVYLAEICNWRYSFKTHKLMMKVNVKRVIYSKKRYPFVSIL